MNNFLYNYREREPKLAVELSIISEEVENILHASTE